MKDKEFEKTCLNFVGRVLDEIESESAWFRVYEKDKAGRTPAFIVAELRDDDEGWHGVNVEKESEIDGAVQKLKAELRDANFEIMRTKLEEAEAKLAEAEAKLERLENPTKHGKPASECECETVTEKEAAA